MLSRNLQVLTLAAVIDKVIIFHLEDVYEAVKSCTDIHRILDNDRSLAEGGLHALKNRLP